MISDDIRAELAYRDRQYVRQHTCCVPRCDAAHEDVRDCVYLPCGKPVCADHATEGMCPACAEMGREEPNSQVHPIFREILDDFSQHVFRREVA